MYIQYVTNANIQCAAQFTILVVRGKELFLFSLTKNQKWHSVECKPLPADPFNSSNKTYLNPLA